jgi:H+/Cl- antiporter ClcA
MVHIGSIVAEYAGSHWGALGNHSAKRDFISCGAAAGVAAAFGAPIAGVLFSLEEGASFWSQQLTLRAFFCAVLSATAVALFLAMGYDYFGIATAPDASFIPGMFSLADFTRDVARVPYVLHELPLFMLLGALAGGLGAGFTRFNAALERLRGKLCPRASLGLRGKLAETLGAVVAFTAVAFLVPCVIAPGSSCVAVAGALAASTPPGARAQIEADPQEADKFLHWQCPVGQVNHNRRMNNGDDKNVCDR